MTWERKKCPCHYWQRRAPFGMGEDHKSLQTPAAGSMGNKLAPRPTTSRRRLLLRPLADLADLTDRGALVDGDRVS